jgi:hypothetical protein
LLESQIAEEASHHIMVAMTKVCVCAEDVKLLSLCDVRACAVAARCALRLWDCPSPLSLSLCRFVAVPAQQKDAVVARIQSEEGEISCLSEERELNFALLMNAFSRLGNVARVRRRHALTLARVVCWHSFCVRLFHCLRVLLHDPSVCWLFARLLACSLNAIACCCGGLCSRCSVSTCTTSC